MSYKAAIFDMDGTLLDSSWVWDKVDAKFHKMMNIKADVGYSEEIMHMPPTECAIYTINKYKLSNTPDEVKKIWYDIAKDLYEKEVKLKPGASKLLEVMVKNNIKICLATSCYVELSELSLKKNNIYDKFNHFLYCDKLGVNKKSADLYLACAEQMKISPKCCAVFEDIIAPLNSVKAYDMGYFAVDDIKQTPEIKKQLKKQADFYINDFNSFIKYGYFDLFFIDKR